VKTEQIYDVIQEKWRQHPELIPLKWEGLKRVLARENVGLFVMCLPRPAQLVQYRGAWSILVNSSLHPRRHTYYAAHELGHLWLHHDRTCERWERCYNMDDEWQADPREDDAEMFAMIVMGGYRNF
jgi:hypothetical protein